MSEPKVRLSNAIGVAYHTIRSERKVSQAEFAELLGIDRERVAKLERGRANQTIDTLQRYALHLGLQAWQLVHIAECGEDVSHVQAFRDENKRLGIAKRIRLQLEAILEAEKAKTPRKPRETTSRALKLR